MNKKMSSKSLASNAAKPLKCDSSSAIQKSLAASVLSQRNPGNVTGKKMESKASAVMRSNKYSEKTKSFAASLVSQSDQER